MKLTNETIQALAFFEQLTHAKVKDCFFEKEKTVFVVEQGEMSKAIGKNGVNVKKMQQISNKQIKVVEFNPDVKVFLRNYLMPIKVHEITVQDKLISLKIDGIRERGIIIGRDRSNLEHLKNVVNKYFDIQEIKVV
ncbi:NusA-like transcription termination signal-binding factor [Candidatus Woesearchaeota archaeon]|nr:NusA-like transcription termination signal-binding factor [Candidatus Woesearchaeota archaeon]